MKVNPKTPLKNLQGEPMSFEDTKEVITVGRVISNVLANTPSKNQYQSWLLAKKFATEKEVDLKSNDIVFIKEIIEKAQLKPIHAGQIIELIEK